MRKAALVILVAVALSGCAGPVWLGAALGFGASALKLDDDLLIWYLQQKGSLPKPTVPAQ